MKLRELIKDRVVLEDVAVFANALRTYDDKPPQISLGMYRPGTETRELFQLELTRESAEKIIQQLSWALSVQAYSPQEIEHHNQVVADRKEEGRNL